MSTPVLQPVFELFVELTPEVVHGTTPRGQRSRAPIVGGVLQGPQLRGQIISGGSDWQLLRGDGWLELQATYDLCLDDGTLVHVSNHGLWYSATGQWPADYAMSSPRFEAPLGPHAWLNQAIFLADVRPSRRYEVGVDLQVWQVQMPACTPT